MVAKRNNRLAHVTTCMVVNERRFTEAGKASREIAHLIKVRMRRLWERKTGLTQPNHVSWIVLRLYLAEERAYRRVLPICQRVLGE